MPDATNARLNYNMQIRYRLHTNNWRISPLALQGRSVGLPKEVGHGVRQVRRGVRRARQPEPPSQSRPLGAGVPRRRHRENLRRAIGLLPYYQCVDGGGKAVKL